MTETQFDGEVKEYAGEKLSPTITYGGKAKQYENVPELRAAGAFPSDVDILAVVNAKLLASAKSAEYQKATKALKEAYEASPAFKKAAFVKNAVGLGFSQEEAEALAATKLG